MKTQPSSQPHAAFFESNDAIPSRMLRRLTAVSALLVVPRLGTNPSNVRVQYIFGLGDALSLMADVPYASGVMKVKSHIKRNSPNNKA